MMLNNAELVSNAARALDRYKAQERELDTEIATLSARLEMVREFISALGGKAPVRRGRPPKSVEQHMIEAGRPIANGDGVQSDLQQDAA